MLVTHLVSFPLQELLFVVFVLFSLSVLHKLDYFGCRNVIILIKIPHLCIDAVSLRKLISHLAVLANAQKMRNLPWRL